MKQPNSKTTEEIVLSEDPVARLVAVGHRVFGKGWRSRMAVEMAVGRATVYAWVAGRFAPPRNLDELLLAVVERQREFVDDQHRILSKKLAAMAAALKRRADRK